MIINPYAFGGGGGGGGGANHRYWRLYITQAVSDTQYCAIAEVEWRLTSGGAAQTVSATAASTTLSGSFPSSEAADGIKNDANNCWVCAAAAFPCWISFDLGSDKGITEVAIWPQYDAIGNARAPEDFLVQYSDNNSSWTTCDTYTGQTTGWNGGTGVAKTFAVTP